MPKLFGRVLLATTVSAAPIVSAHGAGSGLTAVMAGRMAQACFAYAKSHRAAVNVWIYDRGGDVMRFERMDGAPAIGSPAGSASAGRNSATSLGFAIDPNSLDPADPGDVAIVVDRQNIGRVRVAGLGPAGDRTCAEAAVAAAK